MLYKYEAIDATGKPLRGDIEAPSQENAIVGLQRRGLTITAISGGPPKGIEAMLTARFTFFGGVSRRDIVFISREIATLFEAQVSALRIFQLLAGQATKPLQRDILTQIASDLQNGDALSVALGKHPKMFSNFYVNMVRAGEESGKLDQTFMFLADYLDRAFELASKAKNALIYPAFVLVTFIAVMTLMLTVVIPKITPIITEAGQAIPIYTQVVIAISDFLIDYGIFVLIALIIGGFFLYRWAQTPTGRLEMDRFKINIPYIGDLYRKLYMTRIADNMNVMLSSGITAVRALEITQSVVENAVYEQILTECTNAVKGGAPISATFAKYPNEVPVILTQMIQVGEETGELGSILERLAKFYQREVNTAVDTLVNLIEPMLIVALALGVGFLLAAVLLPIYNLSSSI
jgi:type IV pilus assembly protein PilC